MVIRKMIETHMFWAYGNISNLEIICMKSFLKLQYSLNLWTYGDISNAPTGTKIRDAREVLPESKVFLNRYGSYAGFSDLFRYAVLNTQGGLYVDTDVIALKPPIDLPKDRFLVSERVDLNKAWKINGNVIFNPHPSEGNVIDLAFAYSLRFPKADIIWEEIGPDLLTAITNIYRQHNFEIKEPNFANSINPWDCPSALLTPGILLERNAAFLHCYNEMWRRTGIDKNSVYPRGSLMASFAEEYLLPL
jgi:mannosyltransferase OCH1-like enzyme